LKFRALDIPFTLPPTHVERQNLNIRMGLRRLTRLTNAFSKKIDMHIHALSLYFVFYNFVRTHKAHRPSPAMAAGVANKLWSMEDIVSLIGARAAKPGKREPYRKRAWQGCVEHRRHQYLCIEGDHRGVVRWPVILRMVG
jgi:hypothetical protein